MAIAWVDSTPFRHFTRVLAVVDVVESTRLLELDLHGFVRRWHAFVAFVRERLPRDGGHLHRSLGDGLMLEFADAPGCVRCALAMHAWFREGNEGLAGERQLHLRIGAHVAQFLADEHDIYGIDVNLTSRIAALAGAGELVVSETLRRGLGELPEAPCTDLGECHVKHASEPVHAWRVGPRSPVGYRPAGAIGSLVMRAGLAVLPFAPAAGAGAGNGAERRMTEAVAAALARTGQLELVAPPARAGDAARLPVAGAARPGQARYLLAGKLRVSGHRAELALQLREAGSGTVVWIDRLRGELDETGAPGAALPGELACRVLGAVMAHELACSQGRMPASIQGYTLLFGAVALLHRLQLHSFEQAQAMLEHLAECCRNHPDAHAWLAHARVLGVQQGWSGNLRQEAARALRHSQCAVECGPQSVLALVMDGLVHCELGSDASTALLRASEALQLDARAALAWLLRGRACALLGQPAAALEATQRALQLWPLLPLRPMHDTTAAVNLLLAGAHRRAARLAERAVRGNPRQVMGWQALALARAVMGEQAGAQAAARRLRLLAPGMSVSAFLQRGAVPADIASRLGQALADAGVVAA